jgi:hypothetical protein
MTDIWPCCPFLYEAAGLTVSSTSCPSIVRNSIKRPMDTDTGRQRISVDTCACVVPNSRHPLKPMLDNFLYPVF